MWQNSVRQYWIRELERGLRFYRKNQVFLDYWLLGQYDLVNEL